MNDHFPLEPHAPIRIPFYEPPEVLTDTVFDPYDETFGPIMAAIKRGDFVDAARGLLALERRLTAGSFTCAPHTIAGR